MQVSSSSTTQEKDVMGCVFGSLCIIIVITPAIITLF
jgi:hypothetical protein